MGRHAVQAITEAPDLELVAELGSADPLQGMVDAGASHVLDLTVPQVSPENVAFAVERGLHAVVGTSGWSAERRAALQDQLEEHPEVGVLMSGAELSGPVPVAAVASSAVRAAGSATGRRRTKGVGAGVRRAGDASTGSSGSR